MTDESSKANSFQTFHGMGSGTPDLFDLMPLRALYTICVSTSRCSGTGKNEPGIIWGNGPKSAVRPAKKVLKLLASNSVHSNWSPSICCTQLSSSVVWNVSKGISTLVRISALHEGFSNWKASLRFHQGRSTLFMISQSLVEIMILIIAI